jgi:hypothetical protein
LNANGHDPRPSTPGECREGRAGRRLEVDDPIINRNFSRSFLRHSEDPQEGTHEPVKRFPQKPGPMMKYRNKEYTVVQGIERGVWKWSTSVDDMVIRGQAAIKSEAVAAAEKAIDRALAAKKVRLITPKEDN